MLFFYKWFTIRGISKYLNISIPQTPRVHISVPLNCDKRFSIHQLSIDSDLSETSREEVDVQFEGSITSISSSSSCEDMKLVDGGFSATGAHLIKLRNTPDIVRTIRKKPNKRFGSNRSLTDNEIDPGFFSDGSANQGKSAFQKLEELQQQFCQMQRDIAELVQYQQNEVGKFEMSSLFRPLVSSSPSVKAAVAPPPPCLPPLPPAPPTPIQWKKPRSELKPFPNHPDMLDLMKEISTVKLRPVRRDDPQSPSGDFSFNPRLPLRSVTKHESIIADALRERFKKFRMLPDDDNGADTTDEWHDDDDGGRSSANNSHSNVGRLLLRKVDRSQLPPAVSRDLSDFVMENGD